MDVAWSENAFFFVIRVYQSSARNWDHFMQQLRTSIEGKKYGPRPLARDPRLGRVHNIEGSKRTVGH